MMTSTWTTRFTICLAEHCRRVGGRRRLGNDRSALVPFDSGPVAAHQHLVRDSLNE